MAKISIITGARRVTLDEQPCEFTQEEFDALALPPAIHAVQYDEHAASGHIEWQGPAPNTQMNRSMFEGMFRHTVEVATAKLAEVSAKAARDKAERQAENAKALQQTPAATPGIRKPLGKKTF